MIKCYNFDVVCQEIPDEVTLALNISGCPNHCKGCHSPWLWKDEGVLLDEKFLSILVERYKSDITCICFMGGDQEPATVNSLAAFIKNNFKEIKTAWYSGLEEIHPSISLSNFDFIKIGPYIEEKGPLRSPNTNQKFFFVGKDKSLTEYHFPPKNG
ncbi:MAG: anaerobic ribonucleoside-triphosphate reductase activating protein [Bacteroidales bacterium]|nr:anaerobic ribonucleoside-triphosphate reductase activating protein [Bacteroidales bacterium]MBR4980847.1 anaerobic ribonucleoside-triphosphate reductase activating protein [Bacteroidales bacterium]